MKVKSDFVTNSSSSSFIVLTKDFVELKAVKAILKELAGESKMLPDLPQQIADTITDSMEKITVKGLMDDYGYMDIDEFRGDNGYYDVIFENPDYPNIFVGSVANDTGNEVETMLCEAEIDYKDNYIIIKKDGGF